MSGLFVDNEGKNRDWKKIGYRSRSAFAVLLSLAVLIGMGWGGYSMARNAYVSYKTTDDYLGDKGDGEVIVTIANGLGPTGMGYVLLDADVIKSMKAWNKAVSKSGKSEDLKFGRYRVKKRISAEAAVAMLLDPKNMVRNTVTIPEGLRADEQWPLITKKTKIPVKDLKAQFDNPKDLGLPSWSGNKAEGFLFPNTYEIDDKPTAKQLMSEQVKQFSKVSSDTQLEARASQLGLTPMQVLIIASLAEKEVHNEKDLKLVTGVIMNRLAKKMPLQLDSTVIYANGGKGRLTTTDAQRAINSPYNTYKVPGLPAGPISNPGQKAIEAALSPTKSDFLYFVVVDPAKGTTAYAKDDAQHQKNVLRFQKWCQAHPGTC